MSDPARTAPASAVVGALPRFDVGALRALAGATTFARGEAYFREGRVAIVGIGQQRVTGRVAGTREYHTSVAGHGRSIRGTCSCPAFEDWGFCKHIVSVALAANAAAEAGLVEESGPEVFERILNHLKSLGTDALADMVLGLAEADPALLRRLDFASLATHGDEKVIAAQLRRAIDDATGTPNHIRYREAAEWAADVAEVLDTVAGLVPAGRGAVALELAIRAIDRIEEATGAIDDSNGHCGELLARARGIHLAAALAVRPDPLALARGLFARDIDGAFDTFADAVTDYAELLGDEGMAEYERLATERWSALPGLTTRRQGEFSTRYARLESLLDFFAARRSDVDARIALRTKDLSSPWKYLQLATFCLENGREERALRRAEEGLWVFEDQVPDERLVFFTVNLLVKHGRQGDAEAHLWRAFERTPSIELYTRLRSLVGEPARDRAIAELEARLERAQHKFEYFPADLLVYILVRESMFEAAWTLVRRRGASVGARRALARASESSCPREALEVYAEQVDGLAGAGNSPAYEEAAALVAHMATLSDPAGYSAYVADLKTRFGRKRNFMKLLG